MHIPEINHFFHYNASIVTVPGLVGKSVHSFSKDTGVAFPLTEFTGLVMSAIDELDDTLDVFRLSLMKSQIQQRRGKL